VDHSVVSWLTPDMHTRMDWTECAKQTRL